MCQGQLALGWHTVSNDTLAALQDKWTEYPRRAWSHQLNAKMNILTGAGSEGTQLELGDRLYRT